MPEPFKNLLGPEAVNHLESHFSRVHKPFPSRQFQKEALDGLDALELKQRVSHLAATLARHLPEAFPAAASLIEATLAPARLDDDLGALQPGPHGLAGWPVWPLTEFVALHGAAHPPRALECLRQLTQRFSAEFAIRTFLANDLHGTLSTVTSWLDDPSPHVRRLASEGTRPLLPWGLRLSALVRDPSPTLPLLARLHDDPSEYVRRSVANHVNDVSKHHPRIAVSLARDWLARSPGTATQRLAARALRTLIKKGDVDALATLGFTGPAAEALAFSVTPLRPAIGSALTLSATLRNPGSKPARIAVDYAIHHPGADGTLRPKVFKGAIREIPPGQSVELTLRHPLRTVTVRTLRPGKHLAELRLNGQSAATLPFHLTQS